MQTASAAKARRTSQSPASMIVSCPRLLKRIPAVAAIER
jgi:hypothetical protein